jgi:Uma2 family endonuclease
VSNSSVTCGDREVELLGKQELLTNPVLIIEVLSPTSEAFDRGDKFTYYKSIQSFREYLLIAQHRPHVTHFFKEETGEWKYEEFNSLADTVELTTVGISLTLNEIYQGIIFGR